MADIVATAEWVHYSGNHYYFNSTGVTTTPTTYSYGPIGGENENYVFSATAGDPFTYSGSTPNGGTIDKFEIWDTSNTTLIVSFTNINALIADVLGAGVVSDDQSYQAMFFNSNDTFSVSGAHNVSFFGDAQTIEAANFPATTSGNDIMSDGVGAGNSRLVGDVDRISSGPGMTNDFHAGDDQLTSAAIQANAFGDVALNAIGATSQLIVYGGDDVLKSTATNNRYFATGDVGHNAVNGTVHGGVDIITSNSTGASYERLYGDVDDNIGTVYGNNDTIKSSANNTAGSNVVVSGDVNQNRAGATVEGGDDIIILRGNSGSTAAGDVINNLGSLIGGNDDITGTDFNDKLHGDARFNSGTVTQSGDDIIHGGKGNDYIYGDSINGTVLVGGNDKLYGQGGHDTIYDGLGDDLVKGGKGNDTIVAGGGNDDYQGQKGSQDLINYSHSSAGVMIDLNNQTVSGGMANGDVISGFESATGSDFDDVFYGSTDDNVFEMGLGDDIAYARGGDDNITGGGGIDTLSYFYLNNGVSINLADGFVNFTNSTDIFSSIERYEGSNTGDDVVTIAANTESTRTYGGDDTVQDVAGDNIIGLGKGDDMVIASTGNDEFHGGQGNDTLSYFNSIDGVNIDLGMNTAAGGDAAGDTISGFENVIGSNTGTNFITGSSSANIIRTYDDYDEVHMVGSGNRAYLGNGDDYIVMSNGSNYVNGGNHDPGWMGDRVDYSGSNGAINIDLLNNTASGGWAQGDTLRKVETILASEFDDTLNGNDDRNSLQGNGGDDIIKGRNGDDIVDGGAGDDILKGGAGDDSIYGDKDDDTLIGGRGEDQLTGGDGNDILKGGNGIDTFNFADLDGEDTITDFKDNTDVLSFASGTSGITTVGDVIARAADVGGDVLITVEAGYTILIENMTVADLTDDIVII